MRLLQISWRNVFRNKRRTILTMMILILGSTGLITVGGFFGSMQDRLRETVIHSSYGHLQVSTLGYFDKGLINPHDYLMHNFEEHRRRIEAMPHVLYTVPRIKFGGMLSTDKNSLSVIAYGVDPAKEQRMSDHRYVSAKHPTVRIVEGQDLDLADPYGITLGVTLMKALGLKVGDSVSFITTRDGGAIDGADFRIRGVFETVLRDVGDRLIKMNLSTAENILAIPDQVHSLLVILDETTHTNVVKTELESHFRHTRAPLEVKTWLEQGTYYQQSKALMDRIYFVMEAILSIIFIFSISNTISMALLERIREYGTMMAMGNARGTIFEMIFLETTLLGLIGGLLGLIVAIGVSKLISTIGIEMPPLPSMTTAGAYVADILVSPRLLIQTFLITFVATLVSSIIPGYRASHLNIVHALGYV